MKNKIKEPWGHACFVIGSFSYFPFGRSAIDRSLIHQAKDTGTGGWGVAGNIVWVLTFGWIIALTNTISGILFIPTIIGIPFSIQYFKLAGLALAPVGKEIVSKEMAEVLLKEKAENKLKSIRGKLTGSSPVAQISQPANIQIETPVSEVIAPKNNSGKPPWQYIAPAIAAVLVIVLGIFLYGRYNTSGSNQVAKVRVKDGLILRSEPSRTGSKILTIPTDANVEVISTDGPEETISDIKGKWYKLNYSDKSGWGFGGFLDMK